LYGHQDKKCGAMMEIKHTLEILTKDIQDIEKLVGNLQNSPEGSAIEMDLALSKLRNVYEVLTMIREDRLRLRNEPRSPLRDEPIPQGTGQGSQAGTEVKERPEPIPEQAGPGSGKAGRDDEQTVKGGEDAVKGGAAGTKKQAGILAEKFSPESSINENMATRRGKDMDSKLKGQPIDNIGRNIGINDRFFIIRELFDGDASAFRSLLDRLDGASSFDDAFQVIADSFPEQMEHEGVVILNQLVKRRFLR
jgi:hypothetical protein